MEVLSAALQWYKFWNIECMLSLQFLMMIVQIPQSELWTSTEDDKIQPLPKYKFGPYVHWTVHRCDNWRIKDQLDATCYFIVLLIGPICFGHYHAHHQEITTMMLITDFWLCFSLQPGNYSSLTATNFQYTANQERNDQCGNQHYSRELLMKGIMVPRKGKAKAVPLQAWTGPESS